MPRPQTRQQLLDAASVEFARLQETVAEVAVDRREKPGACEQWSVKDLLAHLDAWHEMFLGWEAEGKLGHQPDMPAPGRGWSETPLVNQAIYERTAGDAWDDVAERLEDSHRRVVEVIAAYDNDDLFTKKRYRWTGSTSVGSYATSATSSHYAWATRLIRLFSKSSD